MNKYLSLYHAKYAQKIHTDKEMMNLYQTRFNSPATVQTNLYPLLTSKKNGNQTSNYPIFYIYLKEIVTLASRLRENSKKIVEISQNLPHLAKERFQDSLLLSEITYTNQIEGIDTNEAEISTIIRAESSKVKKDTKQRLKSTVRLYQAAQKGQTQKTNSLEDFRTIYDLLLEGEIPAEKMPNGKLFRDVLPNNDFLRIDSSTQTVHIPPKSEAEISRALSSLIIWMNDTNNPPIFKALVTHFFFENTHPFIDGMGRYLLSTYLSKHYDHYTGLSVSTAIHSQVSTYYKLFKEADQSENFAELTFFIKGMLELLINQQESDIRHLLEDQEMLDNAQKSIESKLSVFKKEEDKQAASILLNLLAQSQLFSKNTELGIKDNELIKLATKSNPKVSIRYSKQILKELENNGLIIKISGRPKQHLIEFLQ